MNNKITNDDSANENKGNLNSRKDVDGTLFGIIKNIQSLPDEIVFQFLKSKGTLNNSDFKYLFVHDKKQS
jgi:hypothetical protein